MSKIESLNQLLNILKNCQEQEFNTIAKDLHLKSEDFNSFKFFNSNHYTRNCIVRTPLYELILIGWEEGQKTPIHCHGGEECWVYLVEGDMEECRYIQNIDLKLELKSSRKLKAHGLSYINDSMGFHELKNTSKGRTLSLHLYANPITKCNTYNKEKQEFTSRKMKDYSYNGKLLP